MIKGHYRPLEAIWSHLVAPNVYMISTIASAFRKLIKKKDILHPPKDDVPIKRIKCPRDLVYK